MKTLTIDTGVGTLTLHFSETYNEWMLFNHSSDKAIDKIEQMAYDIGFNGGKLWDFIAENKDVLVIDFDGQTPKEKIFA